MKTNRVTKKTAELVQTHGGATTTKTSSEKALRRSVMTCMLWEDSFYEDGQTIADRIKTLIPQVKASTAANIAIEARQKQNLRHVPLLIAREMARLDSHKSVVGELLPEIIQRADEMGEFLSLYYMDKKDAPLSSQVRKGLAKAFTKFNEYQLAKYDTGAFRPRDVMFLTHPVPQNKEQKSLFKKVANQKLKTPDTWEVELSAGKGENKKESWERLLKEGKLGAMALLRNLRNMQEVKVSDDLVRSALLTANTERVLPFRFISAAKYAPKFEPELEKLMLSCLSQRPKLSGKTILVIDVSGSMGGTVSGKSEISRMEAAAALAILAKEICETVVVYATAGNDSTRIHQTQLVPARSGFALRDTILSAANRLGCGGIFTQQAVNYINDLEKKADRMIIFSDSQDCDNVNKPANTKTFAKNNYLIDISCEQHGIAYNKFVQINGFSEAVLDYVYSVENE